ncbi:filamentous hemagglutinin N-terminal domain-containing protein [Fusobacterium necrophorum]|uniref:Filamentous hemagglutinin N-terminal domain-containing protein n=1 Tax=Fusobacterium necrophorum TaxID=859 RepID=A0A4Q2KX14_9FUSO|nr:filamentous hemagglutinin N-terminal domain-containing protein [Fusobacterium necrophorum]RXZ69519.1 filamentous hemagglutinin N-terminal domain-containing protein [Fusobacterium necrophorum]
MKSLKNVEKVLKSKFKKRVRITTALVVAFLIHGMVSFDIEARDVRVRNQITPSNSSNDLKITLSQNGTDVINIVNPSNGISHNKYVDFNVGDKNNIIFNNSQKNGTSVTGGEVSANPNLTNSAAVILNEVQGNFASELNGGLEVFGKKADLVIANENGINVNGARFINTSALTLSTGKVSLDNKKIFFNTATNNAKMAIKERGMETDSAYLNILSRRTELDGAINSEHNENLNINVIAGANTVTAVNNSLELKAENAKDGITNVEAISASKFGAMYGNNIFILNTNKGEGIKYEGSLKAKDKVEIISEGKIVSSDINGEDIKISSKEEINNIGKMKADKNVSLNAPIVKNMSRLEGSVRLKSKEHNKKYQNRERGIIYYDYYLNVKNMSEVEDELKLVKSSIEAGNNIEINNNLENGRFENLSGDLKAGNDIKVKGNFKTKHLSEEIKLEELLKRIKVDLRWEHRSLVDNAYFNGNSSLTNGDLLSALKMMTQNQNKEYYTALKQIDNPQLNKILSGLLGADWRTRERIKDEKDWDKEAAISFTNGTYSIEAGNNFKTSGKVIELGASNATTKKETFKVAATKTESLQSTISNVENANIKAKNVYMEADNITDVNVNITAEDSALLYSKNNIDVKGAKISSDKILLEADKDVNLFSELGFKSSGEHTIIKETDVTANKVIGIKSKNLNIYGADVEAKDGLMKIDSDKLNVKDVSTINANYKAELIEGKKYILRDHQYTKALQAKVESTPSKIIANKIFITAKNGAAIEGSLISGKNADSIIQIISEGNVNIKNSNNIDYSNFYSDSRGKNQKGVYKLLKIDKASKEKLDIVGSDLKSEGNINIKSKNLSVVSSKIKAAKKVNLEAEEDIKLLASLNSKKEELNKMEWGSGAINSHKESLEKKDVVSTMIEAGEKADIHAKKDLYKQSVFVKAGSVTMNGEANNYSDALASTEIKKETDVKAGFGVGGKISFAGMGASGEANTLNNTATGKTSGTKGLFEKENEFKEAEARAEAYAKMEVNKSIKESKSYVNNSIISESGDVTIASNGVTDVGNTDINSQNDINLRGKKVETSTKENVTKELNHQLDLSVKGDIAFSNENVNKLNDLTNNVLKSKEMLENKDIFGLALKAQETIKDLKETIPTLTKKDILGIKSSQGVGVEYTNKTSTTTETTASSLKAKGKLNIKADEGDITLKNTYLKAQEFNTETPGKVNLLAGEKTIHKEENSLKVGASVKETVGISVADGANAKIGVGVQASYNGGTDLNKKSLNTTVEVAKVNHKAASVNEDNKTEFYYKDKRGAGVDADLKMGVSSNHIVAADGNVGGNVNYSFSTGKSTTDVATDKTESTDIKAGLGLKASIGIDGKDPDFSISTDQIEYKKDGKVLVNIKAKDKVLSKDIIEQIKRM